MIHPASEIGGEELNNKFLSEEQSSEEVGL